MVMDKKLGLIVLEEVPLIQGLQGLLGEGTIAEEAKANGLQCLDEILRRVFHRGKTS